MAARSVLVVLIGVLAWAAQVPAGGRIWVRLLDPVSSNASQPGDAVRAAVIAPGGAVLTGSVGRVTPAAPDRRAELEIQFDCGRLVAVDNARETVDDSGAVEGILASETLAGRVSTGIQKLGERYAALAGVLGAVRDSVMPSPDTEISYGPGTDFQLELTAPLEVPDIRERPGKHHKEMVSIAHELPFRTYSEKPRRPSDIVNLIVAGELGFLSAGWHPAQPLTAASKFATFLAIAENTNYDEAPVSTLLWNGFHPYAVMERMTNTFAQRHHARVWRTQYRLAGLTTYAVAATHDIGIDVSEERHTFIHRIDSNVDAERDKIVRDLLFSANVIEWEMVDRPKAPRETMNATGDKILTDGKVAIFIIERPSVAR